MRSSQRRPRNKFARAANLEKALSFLREEGLKLQVSVENILAGDSSFVLGLCWQLFQHYQVRGSKGRSAAALGTRSMW